MKSYSYVLLDWDGCLAKTLDIWPAAYKETFREYGLNPTDRIITHEVFGDWDGPKKLGIIDNDGYTKKLLKKVNEKYPTVGLYDHVLPTIKELKSRGKLLALLTTSKRAMLEPALMHNKLMNYFDSILTAEDVSKHKPDPEIIDKSLGRLGGTKETSIIVGDSKSDLGAAINAGIDSLLFYPKHNELFYELEALKTYNPTYIIDDFRNVLDYIK